MAGIGDILKLFGKGGLFSKGSVGEQILVYGVVQQLLGAVMSPELTLLNRAVNEVLQATPLSPAELADMVVRHIIELQQGSDYAKQSGIAPSDFVRLVQSAGEGLAPGDLAEALRRGIIPESGTGPDAISFQQGLAESHLRDKWSDTVKRLSVREPTPADALDALLEGQLPRDQAEAYYRRFGGDPEHFDWLFRTRGSAPTPLELTQMALRGIIPWDGDDPTQASFHQGFLQGPWRDVWEAPYRKLAVYHPPPRTVVTLVHDGVVTDAEALALFQQGGLSPDLAAKYVRSAHVTRGAAHRATISTELRSVARRGFTDGHLTEARFRELLAQANVPADVIDQEVAAANLSRTVGRHAFSQSQIKHQRQSGLIDDAQALQRLVIDGYTEEDAQALIGEWNTEAKTGRSGLTESRILAYLKAGILSATEAYDKLTELGINSANATFLVQHPDTVPAVKTHGSSSADIIAAYKDGILTLEQTRQKLIDAGDTADAADLKLQVAHFALNRGPKPKLQHKNLTEAQVLEAFKLGLVADTWALRELVTLGYSDADASLLVTIEETKKAGAVPATWATLS